ncbi:hypothetical protein OAV62_02330 [bacterium]|nr:hypothetical protein [bacterium]
MSNYPENIDSFAPVTGSDEMTEHAERHTAEESSIVAIETALGTSPEGDSATVADRLDAQDTMIADNTQAISANTQTLAALTTATLPLDQPEDTTAVFATLSTQLDANQYFAQELETKVTEGTTWGALAGRP